VEKTDNDKNGHDDGHTPNPVDRRFSWHVSRTKVLEEPEDQGDHGGGEQEDLRQAKR